MEPQPLDPFIRIGNTRVYLKSWGAADAPTLLCLHGLGGGTHFFAALGTALAPEYRTVAVDLPGSGLSPPLGEARADRFSFDAVADLLVDFARSECMAASSLCLLGHSMGAILGLEMIRRAPDLAHGLIVVDGLPEPLPAARARIRERAAAIRQRGIAGMGSDVAAANFSRRSLAERTELTACFAKLFERQDPGAYVATAEALASWTARELPPLDRVACLAITGQEDRYAPPEAMRAFARLLPPSTPVEVMPGCGHLPFLEQPAVFAAIVSSFLHQCFGGRRGRIT